MPPKTTIGAALRTLYAQLSPKRRRAVVPLLFLMLGGAVAEVLTIGALMPFLAVIAQPQGSPALEYLSPFFHIFGVDTVAGAVYLLAVMFALATIVAAALRLILLWASRSFVQGVGCDLGIELYANALHQPYVFHTQRNSSEIIAAISKVQLLTDGVLMPLLQGTIALVITTFIVAGLIAIDPAMALAAGAGFTTIYIVVSSISRNRLKQNSSIVARTQGERVKSMQEGLGGIRDVLIDRSQPVFVSSYSDAETSFRHALVRIGFLSVAPRFVVEAAGMIMIAVLAVVVGGRSGGLAAAIPVLGALALGAQRLLPLIQQIYDGWARLMGNRQVVMDIAALLDQSPPRGVTDTAPLPFADTITLLDVGYSYAQARAPALKGISFDIRKGARVGIVGKTGSGKSTLMDVILGLLEPDEGEIRIDGVALDSTTRPAWQRIIAHVPQFIYLADTTIAENIAFGVQRKEIDHDRVRRAAKQAELADVLAALPMGLETRIGERGVQLSGGQRQRIGIARALYKQASVLIFDEATSALDTETETAVMGAIGRLDRNLTILIIAHRMSTLEGCDMLVQLEGGQIAAVDAGKDAAPKRKYVRSMS